VNISPEPGRTPLPTAFIAAMTMQFGARFSMSSSICLHHGQDESSFLPMPPDAVVFADSTDEVSTIAKLCSAYQIPMIPHGTGTSLEGHLLAVRGGLAINLSAMNKVLAVRPEDLDVTVQPCVTRKQLNNSLHGTGLFFPIDPGADASLGGMAATRASGTNAVRYGTIRENILDMTVVLADGRIIKTGSRAKKSAAGYDLTHLFIGSEGTLGIITELTVRLHPLPEALSVALCAFPGIDQAVNTVIQTIQMGVPIARIEMMDALAITAINRHGKLQMRETPTLFFEFHGSPRSVEEQVETLRTLAMENGGMDFDYAEKPEERSRLWQARHDSLYAALALRPGSRSITTDVCVPISRLADCIVETRLDLERTGLQAPLVGHVGDGNFHLFLLVNPEDADEIERAESFAQRLAARAIRMEGTCTGEHGIGIGKREFMILEHGEPAVAIMRAIKKALDSQDLMNPGKILPSTL
jgi:D-lactate dehydrogenase (cytochrome)